VWLLGEDAVLTAAVVRPNGFDEASLEGFKPAGVSERKPLTSVFGNTQSRGGY